MRDIIKIFLAAIYIILLGLGIFGVVYWYLSYIGFNEYKKSLNKYKEHNEEITEKISDMVSEENGSDSE